MASSMAWLKPPSASGCTPTGLPITAPYAVKEAPCEFCVTSPFENRSTVWTLK